MKQLSSVKRAQPSIPLTNLPSTTMGPDEFW